MGLARRSSTPWRLRQVMAGCRDIRLFAVLGCTRVWERSRGGGGREHCARCLLGLITCLVWCAGVERWLRVIFDDQLNRFGRRGPVDPRGQRQRHVDTGRDTRAADERLIKDNATGADVDAHRGQDVPERLVPSAPAFPVRPTRAMVSSISRGVR